jgi:N-acetylneuraminic acid mutarotase
MRRASIGFTALAIGVGCGDDKSMMNPDVDAPSQSDGPPSGTCETTTPWAAAPAMARGPTQETAVVAVDGKVYVLGGFDESAAVIDAVQVFDTAACTWSAGPNLPKQVHHANAAVVGGTIYVVGAMQTLQFTAIPDVWSWNPATDAMWSVRASMPAGTQRGSAIVGVIDDKIYVAGGLRGGAVAQLSMYDPAQDMWTTALPPLPAARDHGCGGAVNGKLYVAGGRQGGITTQSSIVYEYTPGGAWVEKAPMPTARGGTACGVIGNRIIVVGGEGNQAAPSGVFPQVEAYDAVADTWASLADMPTPRHGMGAAAWNGRLYVPGGANKQAFGAVATHEVLTP